MNLFELSEEFKVLDKKMMEYADESEDGEIDGFPLLEELDAMPGKIEKKALSIAAYIKNKTASAAMFKAEKANIARKQKAAENVAARFTSYLSNLVPNGQEYENAQAHIKWNKSNTLVIPTDIDIKSIDEKYVKVEKDFRRDEIKKAVIAGEIEWASIDNSKKLKVK